MLHPLGAKLVVSQFPQTARCVESFQRALLIIAAVCICVCVCVVRQSSAHAAAEWGHIWLQLLILPDAFAMMCLSAPGNPLNVFIEAACLTHTVAASLALANTLLACKFQY